LGHRERSDNNRGRSTVAPAETVKQDHSAQAKPLEREDTMPSYLITYHGGPGMPTDPEAAKQMLAAFQAWVTEVGSAMKDPGAPLGAAKTVSAASEADGQTAAPIGGYTVLEAATLDQAVGLVRSHPFLSRGGSLQVCEAINVG
jgi:hypothetical protein